MQNRFYSEIFNALMGIGSDTWDKLGHRKPKSRQLAPFKTLFRARNILRFHIRANRQDICFELTVMINQLLDEATYIIDEVSGFRYLDDRLIIGFYG